MEKKYPQLTLKKAVSFSGIGVHSGRETFVTINPAPENHGIRFKRTDLPGTSDIQVLFKTVVDTSLATVIGENGVIVSTIEHLMAAFTGLGIDNALVEISGHEMPIMDGSAETFTSLILDQGLQAQDRSKCFFIVTRPVSVNEGKKSVTIYPDSGFKITCSIDFDHPLIGYQEFTFDFFHDNFLTEISPARTFGFVKDLEYLKKFGLGRGGSLENAIVIDRDRIVNKEGLRFSDEFVRHKLLDCLGDFSLLGMPIQGHIKTHRSGHALNHAFIKKFLMEKQSWTTGPVEMERSTP